MSGPSNHYKKSLASRPINLRDEPEIVHQTFEGSSKHTSLGYSNLNTKAEAREEVLPEQHIANRSSLPLQWIDEQELRQNKSGLRKTVRSYARRDTCLRQQRRNAATRPSLKAPRNLLEKKSPKQQLLPHDGALEAKSDARSPQEQYHPWVGPQTPEASHVPQSGKCFCSQLMRPPGVCRHVGSIGLVAALMSSITDSEWLVTATRNKLEPTKLDTPPRKNLAVDAAKDQCKVSASRHQIRSVPVCRARQLRVFERSLPETSMHETASKFNSGLNQDNLKDPAVAWDIQSIQSSQIFSLDAKNILCAGSWRSDPFDTFAPAKHPRVWLLFNHCKPPFFHPFKPSILIFSKDQAEIGSTWRPHVIRAFLDWNLSHEVLLHGLLYFAAAHRYILTKELTLKFDILHHKGKVLRIVNESLDDPVLRTSDPISKDILSSSLSISRSILHGFC
jgi:hypothetical protein